MRRGRTLLPGLIALALAAGPALSDGQAHAATKATSKATVKAATKKTVKRTTKATTKPTARPTTTVRSATAKVNANTATIDELTAAFAAAGVPNAEKWAAEVDEYRPYPADPKWGKLRQELGKYHIDPALLEAIIATLEV